MPKTAVIPQGGSITISGIGLYLIKTKRNEVVTIVQNAYNGITIIDDTYTINRGLIGFDKTRETLDFTIIDLSTDTTDFQRTILYRKLW